MSASLLLQAAQQEPTVQWQESTNGTSWVDINGATTSTLSFTTTMADNNKRYRAVWTNSGGSVSSDAANLTVNSISAPVITVNNNCGNSVLTAESYTGSLVVEHWRNQQHQLQLLSAGTYTVTQTLDGCTSDAVTGVAAPKAIPSTPTVTIVNNCGQSVLAGGSSTGSLLWSTGETTASITVATAGTYSVTQTVDGCTSAAANGIAAPKTIPQLLGGLATTATSNAEFTYHAASTLAGTSFVWSRAAITGISNDAANGTGSISEILINTTSSPVNVTYVYTLTANGCTNIKNVVVSVNPAESENCRINNSSVASNFSGTAIQQGNYIWFNSSFDPGSLGTGTDPVTINITNGVINFIANNVEYNLDVPDARIRFDATVTSASTQFINNVWETVVPRHYTNDIFMSGLSYPVPVNFPGNYMNVRWTSDISVDKSGLSLDWRWSAAVYSSLEDHPGINVKPINGITQNPYPNFDRAGTPENFKSFVVDGAKGTGGTNYTGSFSARSTATCAPAVTVVNNCGNSVLTAESFNGSLLWSNGETTPSVTVTTGGTYTVTQTVNGNTSAAGSGTATPHSFPQLSGDLTATATGGAAFTYSPASSTTGNYICVEPLSSTRY